MCVEGCFIMMQLDNFQNRLGPHEVLEALIKMDLRRKGWLVEPFGQSQLSPPMRQRLHGCYDKDGNIMPLRWLPDLLAVGPAVLGQSVVLIDAKSGEKWRETGNCDVEKAALTASVRLSVALRIDIYYIFTDGSAISALELDSVGKWEGPQTGRGSGTPFWLFPKDKTRPCLDFESVDPWELVVCDWADLQYATPDLYLPAIGN
jgi:hypothetical protein